MTDPALLLAPLACSVVLLVSGAVKIRDTDGTREAFLSMKVPAALNRPMAMRSLPYVELALGLLLLITWGWALAVVAAVVTALFATYLFLVVRVLRSGERVDCHCFGPLGAAQVSRWTLARNVLLVVLAGIAVVLGASGGGLPVLVDDLGRPGWAWLVMVAVVVATAVLVVSPAGGQHPADGDLLDYERTPIPFAMLRGENGTEVTLRQLASGRPQLLVFMSVGCGACTVTAERMPEWARTLGPVEVSAVFTSDLAALPDELALDGVTRWYDVEQGTTQTFAPNGRPAAVLLGADGLLAGGPVNGREAIADFVEDIRAELAESAMPEPASNVAANVESGADHHRDHQVVSRDTGA